MSLDDELIRQINDLRADYKDLHGMTLELTEATLELAMGMKHSDDPWEQERGQAAFDAVGRAIDQLKAMKARHEGNHGDG